MRGYVCSENQEDRCSKQPENWYPQVRVRLFPWRTKYSVHWVFPILLPAALHDDTSLSPWNSVWPGDLLWPPKWRGTPLWDTKYIPQMKWPMLPLGRNFTGNEWHAILSFLLPQFRQPWSQKEEDMEQRACQSIMDTQWELINKRLF